MATRKVADKHDTTTSESAQADDGSNALTDALRLQLSTVNNELYPAGLPKWKLNSASTTRQQALHARAAELQNRLRSQQPSTVNTTQEPGQVEAPRPTNVSKKVRYPEYDKMFRHGRLETTIAIGYDEGDFHLAQSVYTLKGLHARGFVPVQLEGGRPLSAATDRELQEFGLNPARVDRNASYFVKPFKTKEGKQVQAVVRLVDSSQPQPKKSFADAMENDSFIMYAGHARYGTGPDFDDVDSPDGNYVIGKPYVNKGAIGPNDLEKAQMTADYQLMLFAACKSKHYTDELRNIPKNKNTSNLDFLTSNDKLSWILSSYHLLTALDGVMAQKSIEEIQADLEKVEGISFQAEGFGDNQYQPPRDR